MTEIDLYCPACRHTLAKTEEKISCPQCQLNFPTVLGIPDLRYPAGSSSLGNEARVETLMQVFPHSTFEEMVSTFLEGAHLSDKIMNKTLIYYRTQTIRSEKMVSMLLQRFRENFGDPIYGSVLDLGCGSGGGACALSNKFKMVYSIDEDMAQLILAKKYIEENLIGNVILICAKAQALPFSAQSFDYIQAINLLEHLEDSIHQVIHEINRALKYGGGFAADSRNRFDIFSPEPHSGIRFLGFLPRKFIPTLVRRITSNHYLSTRLLSRRELSSLLNQVFPFSKIDFPVLEAYGRPKKFDQILKKLVRFPPLRRFFIEFISSHIVVAQKCNDNGLSHSQENP